MAPPRIRQIPLTVEEWEKVTRPLTGRGRSGGHQGLLRKIRPCINHQTRIWSALPQHIEQARHYAADYGGGGYQDRFKALLEAVQREEGRVW